MKTSSLLRPMLMAASLALAVAASPVRAHGPSHHPSDASAAASALSIALPIGVSVAGPAMLLSAGVSLTVVAVQASAVGTVWILERASDGARVSVEWAASGVKAASMAVGTALAVTVLSTGWVLSAAGEAIAFIPNQVGASLIHNEKIQ
jgi:hypothetical protein